MQQKAGEWFPVDKEYEPRVEGVPGTPHWAFPCSARISIAKTLEFRLPDARYKFFVGRDRPGAVPPAGILVPVAIES
jgi:hypothetical protein